ncbi:hypothetical protein ACLOJK_024050 [Asimina triloba]
MLPFGYVLGGGFALSDYRSFDPAIPHRFIHKYRHIDFSLITIILPVGENWSTLSTAATTPHPSRRAVFVVLIASPAPRCLRKASSAPVATTTTPRPSWKVAPTAVVATSTSAIWPPRKATITATTAPRPPRKVISISAAVVPNRQDAQPLPPAKKNGSYNYTKGKMSLSPQRRKTNPRGGAICQVDIAPTPGSLMTTGSKSGPPTSSGHSSGFQKPKPGIMRTMAHSPLSRIPQTSHIPLTLRESDADKGGK